MPPTSSEAGQNVERGKPTERKILVVDDEDCIREIVGFMLRSAGFSIVQASSATEALTVLESGAKFDLMFSDIMMPGLDGVALLQLTKKQFPALPVIILTAADRVLGAQETLLKGACEYLLKPFDRDQLLGAVRRALEGAEYSSASGVHAAAVSQSRVCPAC
jgi:DNA-binding NtrC family response regulator